MTTLLMLIQSNGIEHIFHRTWTLHNVSTGDYMFVLVRFNIFQWDDSGDVGLHGTKEKNTEKMKYIYQRKNWTNIGSFCYWESTKDQPMRFWVSETIKCNRKKITDFFGSKSLSKLKQRNWKRQIESYRIESKLQGNVCNKRKAFSFWLKFNLNIISLWMFRLQCLDRLSSETWIANEFVTANTMFSSNFRRENMDDKYFGHNGINSRSIWLVFAEMIAHSYMNCIAVLFCCVIFEHQQLFICQIIQV